MYVDNTTKIQIEKEKADRKAGRYLLTLPDEDVNRDEATFPATAADDDKPAAPMGPDGTTGTDGTPAATIGGGNDVTTGATTAVGITAVVVPVVIGVVVTTDNRFFRWFFTSMIASIAKDGVHIQYLSLPQ